MSSPSPDPQKAEHAYQPSEASDHGLLHGCTCSDTPKTDLNLPHGVSKPGHHHVINLSHAPTPTSHVHPIGQPVHVHVHPSPKTGQVAKMASPPCTCHVQEGCENVQEEEPGTQGRKVDEDRIEVSPLPPALPPRPPPRPRYDGSLGSRCRLGTGE